MSYKYEVEVQKSDFATVVVEVPDEIIANAKSWADIRHHLQLKLEALDQEQKIDYTSGDLELRYWRCIERHSDDAI